MGRGIIGWGGTLLLATALLAAGCSTGEGLDQKPWRETATRHHGGPVAFDARPVPVRLPGLQVRGGSRTRDGRIVGSEPTRDLTLAGTHLFAATPTGVTAVDLTTGKVLWDSPIPGEPVESGFGDGAAPKVSADGHTVYASAVRAAPAGSAGPYAVTLVALDADSGDLKWSALTRSFARAPGADGAEGVGSWVRAVGEETILLGRAQGDSRAFPPTAGLVAIDATTHREGWAVDIEPGADPVITDELAIVQPLGSRRVEAIQLGSGEIRWTAPDGVVDYESPSRIATEDGILVSVGGYGNTRIQVVDPATGKVARTVDDADPGGLGLSFEATDGSLLYAVVSDEQRLAALDPTSFEPLWTSGYGDRVVFFGGLVYRATGGATEIRDGATGGLITVDAPGEVLAVDEHGMVTVIDQRVVWVEATG